MQIQSEIVNSNITGSIIDKSQSLLIISTLSEILYSNLLLGENTEGIILMIESEIAKIQNAQIYSQIPKNEFTEYLGKINAAIDSKDIQKLNLINTEIGILINIKKEKIIPKIDILLVELDGLSQIILKSDKIETKLITEYLERISKIKIEILSIKNYLKIIRLTIYGSKKIYPKIKDSRYTEMIENINSQLKYRDGLIGKIDLQQYILNEYIENFS